MENPNISGWDAMAQRYQDQSHISTDDIHISPFGPGALELGLIKPRTGERYLELGCGAAQNSIALDKQGATTYAVDGSEIQLQHAKSLLLASDSNTNLIKSDLERLNWLKADAFDGVVSCFAVEFVRDLESFISAVHATLKKNGLLLLATVHPLGAFEWDEGDEYLRVEDYLNPPVELWNEGSGLYEYGVTIFRTIETLFSVLVSQGFSIEKILEPAPIENPLKSPYKGRYWEPYMDRLQKIPFSIVFLARK